MRRWRGYCDVPATIEGLEQAAALGKRLHLDLIYYDRLSRCADTAEALRPMVRAEVFGPRPWRMGPEFEGQEITEESLRRAQHLVCNPDLVPPGGEPFRNWYTDWTNWIDSLKDGGLRVGVVTHNRNIQALYSRRGGVFDPAAYDCVGPDPLSVHRFSGEAVTPWDGGPVTPGIYLIRHAPTLFGT